MLREPQHQRHFLNHLKSLSVRPFGKLRVGSELVEGLRNGWNDLNGLNDWNPWR
jgi:hypothetical protein